jgi:hypothetical protein
MRVEDALHGDLLEHKFSFVQVDLALGTRLGDEDGRDLIDVDDPNDRMGRPECLADCEILRDIRSAATCRPSGRRTRGRLRRRRRLSLSSSARPSRGASGRLLGRSSSRTAGPIRAIGDRHRLNRAEGRKRRRQRDRASQEECLPVLEVEMHSMPSAKRSQTPGSSNRRHVCERASAACIHDTWHPAAARILAATNKDFPASLLKNSLAFFGRFLTGGTSRGFAMSID